MSSRTESAQASGLSARLRRSISALLNRWSGALPCKIIKEDGLPYLERYYLASILGSRIYLHRFVASDPDRGVHDHPWRWAVSLILNGYYDEVTRSGTQRIRWFNTLKGDSFHRVLLPAELSEVWTLFIHHEARSKPWGFLHVHDDGASHYTPHQQRAGEPDDWWTVAPLGRHHPERYRLD